jgi:hypothetical protein
MGSGHLQFRQLNDSAANTAFVAANLTFFVLFLGTASEYFQFESGQI